MKVNSYNGFEQEWSNFPSFSEVETISEQKLSQLQQMIAETNKMVSGLITSIKMSVERQHRS